MLTSDAFDTFAFGRPKALPGVSLLLLSAEPSRALEDHLVAVAADMTLLLLCLGCGSFKWAETIIIIIN